MNDIYISENELRSFDFVYRTGITSNEIFEVFETVRAWYIHNGSNYPICNFFGRLKVLRLPSNEIIFGIEKGRLRHYGVDYKIVKNREYFKKYYAEKLKKLCNALYTQSEDYRNGHETFDKVWINRESKDYTFKRYLSSDGYLSNGERKINFLLAHYIYDLFLNKKCIKNKYPKLIESISTNSKNPDPVLLEGIDEAIKNIHLLENDLKVELKKLSSIRREKIDNFLAETDKVYNEEVNLVEKKFEVEIEKAKSHLAELQMLLNS